MAEAPGARASWDRATHVPSRVLGHSVEVPGSVASPEVAAQFARAFLARHIDVLAPGSTVADFELVSNHAAAGTRTIGFVQRHHGLRVRGGQLSFRFKADRMFVIASEALPDVAVALALAPAAGSVKAAVAEARAVAWILDDARAGHAVVREGASAPLILPLVGDSGVLEYREVVTVTVDGEAPRGRWQVFLDAATGEPVARRQTLMFGAGTVWLNVYERNQFSARMNVPASYLDVTVDGQGAETNVLGQFELPDNQVSSVTTAATGTYADVLTEQGETVLANPQMSSGDDFIWGYEGDEFADAQISAKAHVELAKARMRTIAPDFTWIDGPINLTVNIADICNAMSDGQDLYFFASGAGCENTALLADVVYHELGHSVHWNSLIEGVGAFEGALSEGISDYLAATIVNDASMAIGFFETTEPLRELDPPNYEWHWPEDRGEVHDEGRIIGGTLWDLRKALAAKHGYDEGVLHTDRIWFESIRRAVDIPSMYVEALAYDDDNGNLSDGTPNVCEINAAFGAHGLRTVTADVADVSVGLPGPDGHPVRAAVHGLFPQCGDTIGNPRIQWRNRANGQVGGVVAMTQNGDQLFGVIPRQPDGEVIQYKVLFSLGGSEQALPRNGAAPWYEFYVGEVRPLYCTSFESDPFQDGWTTGAEFGWSDWEWGKAGALGQGDDPPEAFTGAAVFGNDLGLQEPDGRYPPDTYNFARSPVISVGDFREVRLQYRRWLSVEDGIYDNASVLAWDAQVWSNAASDDFSWGANHHLDGEWRFHDIDLSAYIADGRVQVSFELRSDGGLEFGGWTLDDLCVVGVEAVPECGNGLLEDGEACDDGNLVGGDGCDAACQIEPEPIPDPTIDPIPDPTVDPFDTDTDTDTDTAGSDLAGRGCGCTADAPGQGRDLGWFGLALGGLLLARRRRA